MTNSQLHVKGSLALELAYHDTTHNGRQRRVFIYVSTTVKHAVAVAPGVLGSQVLNSPETSAEL